MKKPYLFTNNSIEDLILKNRGYRQYVSGNNFHIPTSTTAGTTINLGIGFFARPSRLVIIQDLQISSDGTCMVEAIQTADTSNTYPTFLNVASTDNLQGSQRFSAIFGATGGNVLLTNNPILLFENSAISFSYKSLDNTTKNIAYTATVIEIPTNFVTNSDFEIAIFGDSTAWGNNLGNDPSGQLYLGDTHWSNILCENIRKNTTKKPAIVTNKAIDGNTMGQGWYGLVTGLNKVEADLTFVSYGMNDCVSTKYQNETRFKFYVLDWIRKHKIINKGKPIVFLQPVQTDDTDRTNNSRYSNINQWIYDIAHDHVEAGETNKVYVYDQKQAFTLGSNATIDINYKERVAGTRVHPSGLGSTLIGNSLYNFLQSKNIFNT